MYAKIIDWHGISAVELKTDFYKAVILPEYGANCIQLIYVPKNIEVFRTPESIEEFKISPVVYGLPILFPPNRICDGSFSFNGLKYEFPINEPNRNHHIHGILNSSSFSYETDGIFTFCATNDKPYMEFPHQFTIQRIYQLNNDGLKHEIIIRNDGSDVMPLGVGVHTAINVISKDTRLYIPVRREWLLNERFIPTEEYVYSSSLLTMLRNGTLYPERQEICSLLEVEEGIGKLINKEYTIQYETSNSFPYIMLWNNHGGKGFICPEPQSWLTNAPNFCSRREESGLRSLLPGESFSFRTKYSVLEHS